MKTNRILDLLELVSSIIFVGFLSALLYFSLKYWTTNIGLVLNFHAKMFSVAMLITVVTVIAQWLEGRIKVIRTIWKRMKRRALWQTIKN